MFLAIGRRSSRLIDLTPFLCVMHLDDENGRPNTLSDHWREKCGHIPFIPLHSITPRKERFIPFSIDHFA